MTIKKDFILISSLSFLFYLSFLALYNQTQQPETDKVNLVKCIYRKCIIVQSKIAPQAGLLQDSVCSFKLLESPGQRRLAEHIFVFSTRFFS